MNIKHVFNLVVLLIKNRASFNINWSYIVWLKMFVASYENDGVDTWFIYNILKCSPNMSLSYPLYCSKWESRQLCGWSRAVNYNNMSFYLHKEITVNVWYNMYLQVQFSCKDCLMIVHQWLTEDTGAFNLHSVEHCKHTFYLHFTGCMQKIIILWILKLIRCVSVLGRMYHA